MSDANMKIWDCKLSKCRGIENADAENVPTEILDINRETANRRLRAIYSQ